MKFLKKTIGLVMFSFIILTACQGSDSGDADSGSANLGGWWLLQGDDEGNMQFVQPEGSESIFILDTFGNLEMYAVIGSENTVYFSSEDELVELTYHSDGDYIDGMIPHGDSDDEYVKLVRTDEPEFISLETRSITVNGNITDWNGLTPQITDTGTDREDCVPAADIESVSVCRSGDYLCFMIDLAGNAAFPHSGHANQEKYVIRIETDNGDEYGILLESATQISLDYNDGSNYTNITSTVGAPGVNLDKIECRITTSLLDDPGRISAMAMSWSDYVDDSYDRTPTVYIDLSN